MVGVFSLPSVLPRMDIATYSHSRESGNLLGEPSGVDCRRTGFRSRGNEWRSERDPIPNDTSTALLQLLTSRATFGILRTRASISKTDNVNDEIC